QLLVDDPLPPRVRRADDELCPRPLLGRDVVAGAAARAVPEIEPRPDLQRHAAVRLGLEDVADVALPGGGGLPVRRALVDTQGVFVEPFLAGELGHAPIPPLDRAQST